MSNTMFVDRWGLERKALVILKTVGNLRLVGETGTGKTTFVHYLVVKHDWKLYEFSLTTDTSRWDLIACDTLEKGSTRVRTGIVTKWLMDDSDKIKVLHLDEFNYAQPNVLTLINQLADFRKSIWIPELEREFKRTEKHYLIISMNPFEKEGYTGTFRTNIAQMRRFETLVLDYLDMRTEVKILTKILNDYEFCRRLVEFANKVRTNYKEGNLSTPITTGNLINYCRMKKEGLDEKEIVEIACNLFLEEERSKVKALWEGGEE